MANALTKPRYRCPRCHQEDATTYSLHDQRVLVVYHPQPGGTYRECSMALTDAIREAMEPINL